MIARLRSSAARSALHKIDALLKRDYPAFKSLCNEQVKQQVKDQINQIFSIFYVIMAVAIIVSLLGVVNTLLMNVLERTREIGVLRAIGSGRWQVRRVIMAREPAAHRSRRGARVCSSAWRSATPSCAASPRPHRRRRLPPADRRDHRRRDPRRDLPE